MNSYEFHTIQPNPIPFIIWPCKNEQQFHIYVSLGVWCACPCSIASDFPFWNCASISKRAAMCSLVKFIWSVLCRMSGIFMEWRVLCADKLDLFSVFSSNGEILIKRGSWNAFENKRDVDFHLLGRRHSIAIKYQRIFIYVGKSFEIKFRQSYNLILNQNSKKLV